MTPELMRLFMEGGGAESMRKYAVVEEGKPLSAPRWLLVAQELARVQEDALRFQVSLALATGEAKSNEGFKDAQKRAIDFLEAKNAELGEAMQLLMDAKDSLQQRFGITPWVAYWEVLVHAFQQDASPLALARSLVRALEETAA